MNYPKTKPILSICIPTMNRHQTIEKTLNCFAKQATDKLEIVIIDGNKDNRTYEVIKKFQKRKLNITYFKQEFKDEYISNQGFDRAVNQAVEVSNADHCWLFTDDDLIAENAIDILFNKLKKNYDLILIPSKIMDEKLSQTLVDKRPNLVKDLVFKKNEINILATAIGDQITFLGSVLIKREIWIKTNKEPFFGSGFIHVGVVLESDYKNNLLLLSQPITYIRFGDGQWHERAYEIWMIDWPRLIWSLKKISSQSRTFLSK
ncbi:glycosyltransferase family 2 protein, partial [Alphaproteobacteria bacterium]|nr:glycosyltransferase family 2 protein [Alphaproteobacteria bacterium]